MRLTLDVDDTNFTRFKRRLRLLRVMFPHNVIKWRVSASKKGYHVKIHNACDSWGENIQLRKWLGDDSKRLKKDVERHDKGLPGNVLFTKKEGRGYAGKWIRFKND